MGVRWVALCLLVYHQKGMYTVQLPARSAVSHASTAEDCGLASGLPWRYSVFSAVSTAIESGSVMSWLSLRFSVVKLVSSTIGFGNVVNLLSSRADSRGLEMQGRRDWDGCVLQRRLQSQSGAHCE